MTNFKHRKGYGRTVKQFTVNVKNNVGEVIYTRELETGVIKNMGHFIHSVIDTLESVVMVDKYMDFGFGDMDLCCEVNGHLLNIEFKGNFVKLLKGKSQLTQAVNMAETSKVTTIFVEGTPDSPHRLFSVSHVPVFNDWNISRVNGIDGLNTYIRRWYDYVIKQKGVRGTDAYDKVEQLRNTLKKQLGRF